MKYLIITLSIVLSSLTSYSEKCTNSVTFHPSLGHGFGKVVIVEGRLGKGDAFKQLIVTKINGVTIKEPIAVKLKMYNKAAAKELEIYLNKDLQPTVVVLGYETVGDSGVPKRVNSTFETMEKSGEWRLLTYFVLVRISTYAEGWPAMRGSQRMNQVRYITHDRPDFSIDEKYDLNPAENKVLSFDFSTRKNTEN